MLASKAEQFISHVRQYKNKKRNCYVRHEFDWFIMIQQLGVLIRFIDNVGLGSLRCFFMTCFCLNEPPVMHTISRVYASEGFTSWLESNYSLHVHFFIKKNSIDLK